MKLIKSTLAVVFMSMISLAPAFAADLVGGSNNNSAATVPKLGFVDCTNCETAVMPSSYKYGAVSFNTNQGAYTDRVAATEPAPTSKTKSSK